MTRGWPFVFALLAALPVRADAAGLDLADGDRVVLIGNTFIERDQAYGYLETGLTLRHPGRHVVFRNLGWSGDTVFGEARASFDPPPVGFQRLKEHVLALKPTVIVVGYGGVEAFEGEEGLPRFLDGLKALLDALAETRARLVLVAPVRQEDLGRPLPDPVKHNADLRLYRGALRTVAEGRGARFVDLFDHLRDEVDPSRTLTDNGIHLTAFGYWVAARAIERGLGIEPPAWVVTIDGGRPGTVRGTTLAKVQPARAGLRFEALDDTLPFPTAPAEAAGPGAVGTGRLLRVGGLPAGLYTLRIDGKPIAHADAADLAAGLEVLRGPELDQVEQLRRAIVKKDLLYFYRWRPQNETYLFGFRKYEQGQNAQEVVKFDPLVAAQEAAIARLAVPVAHTYELTKDREGQSR